MKQKLSASVTQEGEWFVAQCLEIDVASQGSTEEEALKNLKEAVTLHLEPPSATVLPHVKTIEIDVSGFSTIRSTRSTMFCSCAYFSLHRSIAIVPVSTSIMLTRNRYC